ncbi:hypothetical protein CHS0354_012680 [Potamilus streckersoni]|uniref:Alpha-amylase n=1 Tax=Potamilus streckersoni TaxID=2493646 RepID=A0AAE0W2U4_9BIVA|nr:hypothetical protein CHS0354_012680 [Potamilus streckersoni]
MSAIVKNNNSILSSSVSSLFLFLAVPGHSQYTDPHCNGKQVIVHLFEWKWTDIALECERFLAKKGFCGVQVSPVNEHAMVTKDYPRPWWERYQPVSYKLTSRSGIEAEFVDMVQRCKKVGVRVFVDAVVNHMAGLGRTGTGTAGSTFNSDNYDFPGVPFSRQHFNMRDRCPSHDGNVNNYGDPNNVRNCHLVGLTDLDQSQDYVQNMIAAFFNHLIDIGVAGFRIDAAKHMWPKDITAIQNKVKDLPEGGRPFFYHEVIDQNDGAIKTTEYTALGYVTEFRYCQKIAWGIRNFGDLNNVVDYGWHMTQSSHAFIFVDNHDNQRGHGGGGNLITHKSPKDYKMAVAFTLAYDYGFTRVMSSYEFGDDSSLGPPHNADFTTKDVLINSDGSCGNGWICEHRWRAIANMAAFRNAVAGTDKRKWRNENDQVSFARGNKGFFAMAKSGHMDATLDTGLPAGVYCDLITDCAQKITVDGSGSAHIVINNNNDPIIAFVVGGPTGPGGDGSGSGSGSESVTTAPLTTITAAPQPSVPTQTGWQRTVIFVEKRTVSGEDLFIRGGLDHSRITGCTSDATSSHCAIPIRHKHLGTGDHYAPLNAWNKNDNFLDWYGAESGQGSYHGRAAEGTPAVWTSSSPTSPGYNSLNKYGEHYWLVDIDMDCDRTENGWFELKGIVNGGWESNLTAAKCTGNAGASAPHTSGNHWARCGYLNVFHWNSGTCEMNILS